MHATNVKKNVIRIEPIMLLCVGIVSGALKRTVQHWAGLACHVGSTRVIPLEPAAAHTAGPLILKAQTSLRVSYRDNCFQRVHDSEIACSISILYFKMCPSRDTNRLLESGLLPCVGPCIVSHGLQTTLPFCFEVKIVKGHFSYPYVCMYA